MNDRLQQNLADARNELLTASANLNGLRLSGHGESTLATLTVKRLYRALDRVWELQCMANGVFG